MTPFIASFGPLCICNGHNVILYTNQGTSLAYQWYLNGKPISGAITNVYYASMPGNYTVWITKGDCINIAEEVQITQGSYPEITLTPSTDMKIFSGDSIELRIEGGSRWQWYRNFIPIDSATQNIYFAKDSGYYHAEAFNGNCARISKQIKVDVLRKPFISTNFNNTSPLQMNDTIVLRIEEEGSYQWYKNNNIIPGETKNELQVFSAGRYSVEVDNGNYKIMSEEIEITFEQVLSLNPNIKSSDLIIKNNPFSLFTTIQFPSEKADLIYIRDVNGNIISQLEKKDITDEISLGEQLPAGVYYLQVFKGRFFDTIRIIKSN
jgi:hypothetical protein